ncbi:methylenetetrahydrofolate reductase [NAD(P)H] [Rhizobium sp. CFBP 8762]|uniref:methylenetetrahydrofolate reductase [NAD(P)H] n=1 Tax=Rhizobium sp. CFBP 8762 TaxID=2775279 RepID=UPI00177CEC6A|nr:methylenetetrahydrofolate reductase [NAD(P)H] [Rhizobium sp. CFBP 8762]MBD8554838.1 methylenetetrahydrofolate reductase [NAD(P)H] [Rhizobium sp. CFBP 8762]
MTTPLLDTDARSKLRISFEFFPPKSPDGETGLIETARELASFQPDFVSVTYGAGGSTKEPSLRTVDRLIHEAGIADTAAHLTCVGASREDVDRVVDQFVDCGVQRFVALRGDGDGGVGSPYQPHPGGYINAADLVSGLRKKGDFDISVSAYPEKHPQSADVDADIDMLKRKVDNGAARAITQFFFDNDDFERYLNNVRAAGITIPILPGILPVHNLSQVSKFAGMCGARIPDRLRETLGPLDDRPDERTRVATMLAAQQVADLFERGVHEFHFYTMNRSTMVGAVCDLVGFQRHSVPVRQTA